MTGDVTWKFLMVTQRAPYVVTALVQKLFSVIKCIRIIFQYFEKEKTEHSNRWQLICMPRYCIPNVTRTNVSNKQTLLLTFRCKTKTVRRVNSGCVQTSNTFSIKYTALTLHKLNWKIFLHHGIFPAYYLPFIRSFHWTYLFYYIFANLWRKKIG